MLEDTACYYTESLKGLVENNLRHIDFGDDHELQEKYDNLPERFKVCVNNTLDALTGGYDNVGYNLKTILEIQLNSPRKISLGDISFFLYEIKEKYWDKELLDLLNTTFKQISKKTGKSIKQIDDEFAILARKAIQEKLNDCISKSTSLNNSQTITQNAISKIKKSHFEPVVSKDLVNAFIKAIPNYTYLKLTCEGLFLDMDVLLYGVGRHYEVNNVYCFYFEYDDLHCGVTDPEFVNYCEQRSAYTLTKQAEAYETYLLEHGELEDDTHVLKEDWLMLEPSGKYLMLKEKKMPNGEMKNIQQDAIRALIDTLSIQAEHFK